tara:strand:+ start:24192 stop:25337 length:1146 start_codon:yes stop_codon:yes gene_type:complete
MNNIKKLNNIDRSFLISGDLNSLMKQAKKIRDKSYGNKITYSRKVFVPLTNICRNQCGYCTFVKNPNSPSAKVLNPEQVMEIVSKGEKYGCKEVLFSLGEKPELKYLSVLDKLRSFGHSSLVDYLSSMCQIVNKETNLLPHTNIGTLNKKEIDILKPVTASMGMMLETTSNKIFKKGGAHYKCPDKVPSIRIRTIETAGELKVPFTTGILIGIGETWDDRINSILKINDIHKKYGHIQEVIIQNFRAKIGIPMQNSPEPSLDEMLRTIAISRIILEPEISIQAPPNLSNQFLKYLDAGINDWGGISPVTIDHINPEREWPQIDKLNKLMKDKGYKLRERLTIYPKFQKVNKNFMSANMVNKILNIADNHGLAINQISEELL